MQNGLDRLLATYCSPTLAGIKPASLVSCDRNLYPDLPQRLKEYRDAFSAREIHFEIVCACSARFLLLVYSKPQLERRMADPQVQHVLRHFAYPVGQPLDVLLRNLKRRIAMSKDFPHEIGLFLGYPIEDVVAYSIRRKGLQIKRSLEGVRRCRSGIPLFDRLSRVCHAVTRRVDKGETLLEVFAA